MKCPICGDELNVYESYPSLLGMAVHIIMGCEQCGFTGEVKLHPDNADEIFGKEWREVYHDVSYFKTIDNLSRGDKQ